MSTVAYATLPVIPSFQNFTSDFNKQVANPLAVSSKSAGSDAGNNIASGIKKALLPVAGIVAGVFSVRAIAGWVDATVGSLSRIETLNAQTESAIRATGGAANVSAAQVENLTGKLEDMTGTEAETIQKGANFLLTFKNIKNEVGDGNDIFDQTVSVMTDMARATGQDMQSAALQLGKALNDPIAGVSALARVGVQFTDQQKDQIAAMVEAGDVMGAQKLVLGELNSQFGGSGAAYAATYAGKITLIGHAWGTFSETIIGAAMPAAGAIADRVLKFLQDLNASPAVTNWASNFQGWLTRVQGVAMPVLDTISGAARAFGISFQVADGDVTSSGIAGYMEQLGYIFAIAWGAVQPLIPALVDVGGALFSATQSLGISIFQLLPPVLMAIAQALQIVVPWVTSLSGFLVENQGIVVALVAAYALYRGISLTIGVVTAAQAAFTAASYGAQGASYGAAAATTAQSLAAKAGAAAQALMSSTIVKSTAGWIANTVAVATNSSLTLGTKAAIIGSSVATGIATAAQWAWNAALSANPIGIIILAIAALVAGIIWVATQTTFFQDLWTNVTNVIGAAWTWLWGSVLEPVFTAIGAIFTWIFNFIIMPIVTGIMIYVGIWAAIFTWLWEAVLAPVFAAIGAVFTWIWNTIIMPIVGFIVGIVQLWAGIVIWLWASVISVVFNAIGAIFQWVWDSIISPVVDFISLAIQGLGIVVGWLWDNAINPALQAIGSAFDWLWNSIISPVATFINAAITVIGSTINSVFSGIADFIGSAFNAALDAVRGPINGIIGLVNGAIDGINSLSVTIPAWVPLVGGQTFSANIPRIPSLASGANIMARSGGTLALLGEGGRSETVTDLGDTNRMIRATTALAEDAGGGDSVVFRGDVYTQDPDELAEKINRKKKKARMANGKKVKVG